MAGCTEGYEIGKCVGFFISFYTEFSKGDDVMNIMLSFELFFRGIAYLAGIIIALACLSALSVPIGAIICNFAAIPSRMILTADFFRSCFIPALTRTKASSFFRGWNIERFSAFFTYFVYVLYPVWVLIASKFCSHGFRHALFGTKSLSSLCNRRRDGKLLATVIADYLYGFYIYGIPFSLKCFSTALVGAILSRLRGRARKVFSTSLTYPCRTLATPVCIGAGTATKGRLSFANVCSRSVEFLTAHFASENLSTPSCSARADAGTVIVFIMFDLVRWLIKFFAAIFALDDRHNKILPTQDSSDCIWKRGSPLSVRVFGAGSYPAPSPV